jgi:spore germination cell wall hydrolase CwlJ-like protein
MRKIFITICVLSVVIVAAFFNFTAAGTASPMIVEYYQLSKEAKKQVHCLTENILFEAGYEPDEGKLAVALVTLNRVASPSFPNTICEVVYQKTAHVCQFSWYCDNSFLVRRSKIVGTPLYSKIQDISIYAMMNYENIDDNTKGALYYHANYVNPGWKLNVTARIGNHIFYKRSKDPELKREYKV